MSDPLPAIERRDTLLERAELLRTFEGVGPENEDVPIVLKKNERMFFSVSGAALIEPRREPGRWRGASQGVSIRVPGTKSMRYRIGKSKGTYEQGDELPTPIDEGTFTLTTTRAVFAGEKQTREWSWSKLISVDHDKEQPWTALPVSNRQKTSGVYYGSEHQELIRFWIDLAVAKATGTASTLAALLEAEAASLGGEVVSSATWASDPSGRFELRWWDGHRWTDQVSTDGDVQTDITSEAK